MELKDVKIGMKVHVVKGFDERQYTYSYHKVAGKYGVVRATGGYADGILSVGLAMGKLFRGHNLKSATIARGRSLRAYSERGWWVSPAWIKPVGGK